MSRQRTLAVIIIGLLLSGVLFVRQRYVLNSTSLERAIRRDIPVGSTKGDVLNFIKARHPKIYDDYGEQVKVRFTGLAGNMIYKNDVVVTFDFDSRGKLRGYSLKSSLTFL